MKAKTRWYIIVLLAVGLGFILGFWQGQRYLPENTYRAEVLYDWMIQSPEKTTKLFMLHAEKCRLLAKYKPPIPENEIGTAVSEIMVAMQNIAEAENALSKE